MKKIKNKKGFTLIELIVVIAILAVLGLLLVPQISGYIKASKDAVGTANAKSCFSQRSLEKANTDAGLNMTVTVDPKCSDIAADGSVTWTDKDNKVYTYKGGEVVLPQ
ncbi:type II secretion system protein [Anaerorhabdus furcosa]|uniref:Type IV pilus assembly protein PilA n=1 Tax=Anaerorhabdus furcosa TaxID=118967 RepID=A0A1T4MJE4_9FIRM|nr:prepilin-type N-terminal cleavage/methylation domain-containing protein [Anaerorhabdus furcosa]SJZ67159.1 type IV pilus assembly protein PilA [Anaerorhabdus furcosa]